MELARPGTTWLVVLAALVGGCGDDTEATQQEPTSTTVFVDEAAASGGDGSYEHPFRTMREAFEIDRPVEVIAVAAGRYPTPASFEFSAPLSILPSGEDNPVLEAVQPASELSWTATSLVVLRDLSLASPLAFEGGELELRQVSIESVSAPALWLTDSDVRIFDLDVGEVTGTEVGQGDGVVVDGGTLVWTGGTVTQVPDRAVVLRGAQATLDTLTLSSNSRAPLTINDGADVSATSISIEDVAIGVYVDDAALQLDHAYVKNAGTSGVLASALSTTHITASTFSDCPNGHITVIGQGASMTVEDTVLDGAIFAPCIFATSTDGAVVFRGNTLTRCAGSGITLFDLGDALVENNDISQISPDPMLPTLADGIVVIDSAGRIAENVIYDTPAYGISLNRGAMEVDGNDIGPTGEAAITIIETGTAPAMVTGNTIHQATGAGVIVLDAIATVMGNTISDTAFNPLDAFGDGIAFGMNAVVTVQDNTITGSARNGVVFLDGASGTIDGNDASGNAEYGILEFCTGALNSVVIGDNVLDNNTLGPMNLCSQ